MLNKKEKTKLDDANKNIETDFILPLYLNQRFVFNIII